MSMYHGIPLDIDGEAIEKGLQPAFLEALNANFGFQLEPADEFNWIDHFDLVVGFVDTMIVSLEYRSMGIGTQMMTMLKRFDRSVDMGPLYLIHISKPPVRR